MPQSLLKVLKLISLTIGLLASLVWTSPAQSGLWNIKYRDQYLNDLKGCERPSPSWQECNMGTVINVAILDEKGDRRALPALMDTARVSSGEATETLSWYFSELLCKHTQRFLTAVSDRSEPERANLIYRAATGEAKNQGCLSITALRQDLLATTKDQNAALAKLASETLSAVNKWSRPNPNTGDCFVREYEYKSEVKIAAMTPRQLVEEEVQNQMDVTRDMSDKYWVLTHKYLRERAVTVIPILTEYLNAYDPANRAVCDERRYSMASTSLADIDRASVRLRGIAEGRPAIAAMESSIVRMKAAGFEKRGVQSSLPSSLLDLPQLKGSNISDGEIRDTLQAKKNVKMSDAEFERYIDYLVSVDPRYPTWIKLEPGYRPRPLLIDPSRFYQAYLKFKKIRPHR
jgi:hypothetical protein